MEYGINVLSLLPVRSEPDHRSEMVSQLLFGEQFTVIESKDRWIHVECALDGYRGWLNGITCLPLNMPPKTGNPDPSEVITNPMRVSPLEAPQSSYLILPGSTLPNLDPVSGEFNIGELKYKAHGSFQDKPAQVNPEKIAQTALIFLNAPYLWGGRSIFGADCSGLVQVIYKINGIAIPRDAGQQVLKGKSLNFISESIPGDLAFFAPPGEEISHVGMIIDEGHIIHASGKVRIDRFDHQGIYQSETERYSHSLRVINRFFN